MDKNLFTAVECVTVVGLPKRPRPTTCIITRIPRLRAITVVIPRLKLAALKSRAQKLVSSQHFHLSMALTFQGGEHEKDPAAEQDSAPKPALPQAIANYRPDLVTDANLADYVAVGHALQRILLVEWSILNYLELQIIKM